MAETQAPVAGSDDADATNFVVSILALALFVLMWSVAMWGLWVTRGQHGMTRPQLLAVGALVTLWFVVLAALQQSGTSTDERFKLLWIAAMTSLVFLVICITRLRTVLRRDVFQYHELGADVPLVTLDGDSSSRLSDVL